MSLIKLLKTTSSLKAVLDQPHRYKVRTGALPVFGKPAPSGAVLEKQFEAVALPQVRSSEAVMEPKAVLPKSAVAVAEAKGQAPARSRWMLPENPFKSKPSRSTAARLAVQGELSLDKVKPVRNDLSDSDLELVAAVKAPEPTVAVVQAEPVSAVRLAPVEKAKVLWGRVRGLWPRAGA